MPYRVNCPTCQTAYSIPEDALGKKLLCKKCRQPFTIGNPKAAAPTPAGTTTDLPPRPAAKSPARRREADAVRAAPVIQKKKSRLLLAGVLAAVLLVLGGAVAGAIVASIYFLKPRTQAPVAQSVGPPAGPEAVPPSKPTTPPAPDEVQKPKAEATAPSKPTSPTAPDRTEQPPSNPPAVAPEKSSPTTTPPVRVDPPSTSSPPTSAAVHADATRIKIPNPRLAKYEPESKRWVYSFRNAVRATNGMFYIDLLPPGTPTNRDAYAAKLLQKDAGAGPTLSEITEKGDLPDGFFIRGVTKEPISSKIEPAFLLVRKVNGAFLRCRNGTVANRPVSEEELRQTMREIFKQVTIRTTTLISLPPPSGAVLLPDNITLVVAQAETANLIYFDTMAEREVKRVEVDFQPGELVVQGDTLFAAAKGSALVYALEAATGKVKKEHNLGGDGIVHLACHPRKGLLYASTTRFDVVSLDPVSGAVNKTKALGQFLAVSPGGKFLYTGVQPANRDEIEIITRRDGSTRIIFTDMWGPRAMLMKYAVDGPDLRFLASQNNAAVNGWWMHLTPDGKKLMMVGGGGWRPPKEGGTGGGYVTAVFRTDNLQTMAQQIPFSGLNTIFHPILNLGVANSHGMFLTLFNSKSLVKRTSIELNKERESRPLLLMFGGKGRKLILWNGDNLQKEQGLHFLPLPLKAEEEAALAKASEQPAPPEPEESTPPTTPEKPAPSKVQAPKTPEEAEAALKRLGFTVHHLDKKPDKPVVYIETFSDKITDDQLLLLAPFRDSLTKLELLDARGLSDKGLKHLAGLSKLETLSISRAGLTGEGLADLKELTQLRSLDLHDNKLTDAGLAYLKPFKMLTYLELGGNKGITDKGVVHLRELQSLETLRMRGIGMTEKGVKELKDALKKTIVVGDY